MTIFTRPGRAASRWVKSEIFMALERNVDVAILGKKHIKDGLSNSILNRTPLIADTNRHVIKARLPNDHLRADRLERSYLRGPALT